MGGTGAAAQAVVEYARNADKVDGRHAVGSRSSVTDRAGKVVATDAKGRLPNNIVRRAPDAKRLGGFPARRFAKTCHQGAIAGTFRLAGGAAEFGPGWTTIPGYMSLHATGGPPPGAEDCLRSDVQARRMGQGEYEVRLHPDVSLCSRAAVPVVVSAIFHPQPVLVTAQQSCAEENVTSLRLVATDLAGRRVDATIDAILPQPIAVPIP